MPQQPRESPIHDPTRIWKSLLLPAIKASDAFRFSLKAALAVCIVISISVVSYVALFSDNSRRLICASTIRASSAAASIAPTTSAAASAERRRTNLSHIFFGIGGSAATWHQRRHYSELWWRANATRGFVWLDQAPPPDVAWPETSPPYQVSADASRLRYTCWYGSRAAVRIARIVKESFETVAAARGAEEEVRWFVMGDDDTVFFPENLVNVLRKYDHREMYYIGGSSESVEQAVVHSYGMAYGGGGFAVSYPLAAELVKVLDSCIDRYHSFYGSDQKVQACMDEIGVPFTKELGFHQLDIRADAYGVLAAHPVAPLVSLHHLDYLRPIFPDLTRPEALSRLVEAYRADPGRTLQHSFCYDLKRNWTVYVAWGYTVQLYPWLETAKVLETPLQTFMTWKNSYKPFTFNTRSLTPDACKRPLLFFLDRVTRDPKTGRTLTKYNKFERGRGRTCRREDYLAALKIDSFHVSARELESNYWEKAPRRQCCEIIKGSHKRDNTISVKIRDYKRQEGVTPPYST